MKNQQNQMRHPVRPLAGHRRTFSSIDNPGIQKDHQLLIEAKEKGSLATLGAYVRLSGPGWLQSAITLGGASLAGSLYLGVLGGTSLLWVQPLAMIAGIIMLSAISYVTLSTSQRPFQAINNHVNPVLGWGWAIAVLMVNLVFALPQFSLGAAVVRQNLLPNIVGPDAMSDNLGKLIVCCGIMFICVTVVWFYNRGNWGIKVFEVLLKLVVGLIVVCFFGVVVKMSLADQAEGLDRIRPDFVGLDWNRVLSGFVPDLSLLVSPAKAFAPFIAEVDSRFQDFWIRTIVSEQRDVMITAVAAAVGINMTFLMPYSMLKRRWDSNFRGLAIFDLSTGLFIPFILATSCVVIAASAQFHARPAPGFLGETNQAGELIQPAKNLEVRYKKIAAARIEHEVGGDSFAGLKDEEKARRMESLIESLPVADKRMSAMLVRRDALNLAQSLSPLTGEWVAHYVFGIGVIGMAVSTIIILMLINGFVVCEMLGTESKGWPYRLGSFAPCIGVLGPFIWTGGRAQFWLAVPAFIFGMVLLPIAYFTFYLLMNQKSLLGDNMPRGNKRIIWNGLMAIAVALATFGSIWSLWSKTRWIGVAVIVAFVTLVLVVHIMRSRGPLTTGAENT